MKKLLLLALVFCSSYTFADVITIDGKAYDVEIKKVMAFEKALHEFARSKHKDLLDMINSSLDYNDDVAAKMKSTMDDFKTNGVW